MISIYDYKDYRIYLIEALGGRGKRTGKRLALARHLGCQSAFVSQVLSESAHFSLEQSYKINEFLEHDADSAHYFLLMVQKDRAGTVDLQRYFQKQMDQILSQRQVMKNRLDRIRELNDQDKSKYYSSWHYAALHVALSVPELQTPSALSKHFQLPPQKTQEVLTFLLETGLAELKDAKYQVGPGHIHLGNQSENIVRHHSNWRLQALKSLDRDNPDDLHYSVVYSVSKSDAQKIREQFIKVINENLRTVEPSKEEVLYCNTIDFFKI